MRAAQMKERPSFSLMKQTDIQNLYYMQMPRWLFSDPRYAEMNLDVKVTYTFPILDVADSSGAASAVEQEIDNDPIPIFAELTIGGGAAQKQIQFFVAVSFLDGFLLLDVRNCDIYDVFRTAPVQKGLDDADISCYGVVCEVSAAHSHDHCLNVAFGKRVHRRFHKTERIPSLKNREKGCGPTSREKKKNPLKTQGFQGIGAAGQIRTAGCPPQAAAIRR